MECRLLTKGSHGDLLEAEPEVLPLLELLHGGPDAGGHGLPELPGLQDGGGLGPGVRVPGGRDAGAPQRGGELLQVPDVVLQPLHRLVPLLLPATQNLTTDMQTMFDDVEMILLRFLST